jgi:hypothetical protein
MATDEAGRGIAAPPTKLTKRRAGASNKTAPPLFAEGRFVAIRFYGGHYA